MELKPGTLSTMTGPSGVGKTSLCLALMGWMRPNVRILNGEVLLGMRQVLQMQQRQKQALWGREILYIPQSSATALVASRDVVSQISEFARDTAQKRGERRDLLQAAFQRLEVPGFGEDRYPHQYSGGQLQRILISTVFCATPRLIILDEPTTALHADLKAGVMRDIKARAQEIGAAALVISHELPFFAECSDQTIDLSGYVISDEKPKPVRPAPQVIATPRSSHVSRSLPAEQPRLQVDGLCVNAPSGRPLLRDVAFQVRPGACLGVIGRSGAGKTTILRSLLGQHGDAKGTIEVDGERMPLSYSRRTLEQKRRLEYVPQSVKLHLNPALSADYLLRRRLRQAGRDHSDDSVVNVLGQVLLPPDYRHKRSAELSGGECQRLGIALALATNPAVLLLDEVTASLDPANAHVIADILDKHRASGNIAMLLVSHQPEIVARLASDVLELRDGQVVHPVRKKHGPSAPRVVNGGISYRESEPRQCAL
ncbi:ATP-binding cassette domain-containing protein (plasmid) [Sinorhizobium numidicum]|uniref:ATP-binding cassette domain-containing protein n=1 Tax=Sinorhizobium numidicum TaxID=680248 RepID=A0ABY8D343_9HYPH|nr:ATP-binding cassette domain-containing protein [Sinorhizobium numidicum]WEX79319.1 ATP-binding cassette domain-containing protein [Sinorhizobium numidicum]WEX85310.1 ATP-binding cassette domain-containing protein [Sinorhizobium numidicum]